MANVKQVLGYEPYGYWRQVAELLNEMLYSDKAVRFFVEDGADELMRQHVSPIAVAVRSWLVDLGSRSMNRRSV